MQRQGGEDHVPGDGHHGPQYVDQLHRRHLRAQQFFVGLAMISGQFLPVARLLGRAEVRARKLGRWVGGPVGLDGRREACRSRRGGDGSQRKVAIIGADASAGPSHLFRAEITELVVVRLGERADSLVIEAWHAGRGVSRRERC